MTLHPLTKELLLTRLGYSTNARETVDKMVIEYLTGRAEWLKIIIPNTDERHKAINQAFQLEPETLKEKFDAIRQKHSDCNPDFWSDLLTEFVAATEEHFAPKPSGASDKTPPLHLRTQSGWKG